MLSANGEARTPCGGSRVTREMSWTMRRLATVDIFRRRSWVDEEPMERLNRKSRCRVNAAGRKADETRGDLTSRELSVERENWGIVGDEQRPREKRRQTKTKEKGTRRKEERETRRKDERETKRFGELSRSFASLRKIEMRPGDMWSGESVVRRRDLEPRFSSERGLGFTGTSFLFPLEGEKQEVRKRKNSSNLNVETPVIDLLHFPMSETRSKRRRRSTE